MFNVPSFFGFRSGSYGIPFVGLLDTYGGAAAAYSLRGLSTPYVTGGTPYACQVRNSSNATADIGFVYNPLTGEYDLDIAALLAHCGGGDGFVDVWYDQSGNGYDATQGVALNQPPIVSSGSVITQGGKASVYTPGSCNLNTGLLTLPVSGDIDLDFFAVMNQQSSGAAHLLFGLTDDTVTGDRRRILCYGNDYSTEISVRLTGGFTVYSNTTTGQLLFNTNYQGGGGALNSRINGTSLSVFSFNNAGLNVQSSSGFLLMSGNTTSPAITYANPDSIGYMQECIFYLSDESTNRTGIETNINDFYSIY